MRKLLFLATFALATPAFADWAEVPPEVLVDEADLIVVGKVATIQVEPFFTIGPRKSDHAVYHDVAVVEVASVLKASPHVGKPKEVQIGQPGKKIVTSADIRFRPGQQGIWLLTQDPGRNVYWGKQGVWLKDPDRHVYWAKHPGQFQSEKEAKKITDLVEARSKVPGGKPTNGVVARAEILETPGSFQVRFSLKNVSNKPITFCDHVGNRPLQVNWIGPDGQALKSKHYDWLKAADIAGLAESNFVTIPPGGIRFVGSRESYAACNFLRPSDKATNFDNVAQTGQHKVTVSYHSKEDGKTFGLEDVWTGTVTAPEASFTVK